MILWDKLKTGLKNGTIDMSIVSALEEEHKDLKHRADEMEKLLITIVRTVWPWDEEGEPNAIYHASREGFSNAMRETHILLGLNYRTMINRTEPRT